VGAAGTSWTNTPGFYVFNQSAVNATRDGNEAVNLNRLTSDGDIAIFRKDGSAVGSIGTVGADFTIGTGDVALRFQDGSDNLIPHNVSTNSTRDGGINIGTDGARFKDLYLSGGVYLGGTGAANLLDDYEEGTWTPIDASGASLTFATAEGVYTKIGRLVIASYRVIYPSTADANSAFIGGLPFSSGAGFPTGFTGYNNSNYAVINHRLTGSTVFFISNAQSGLNIANSNMSTYELQGTFIYHTS